MQPLGSQQQRRGHGDGAPASDLGRDLSLTTLTPWTSAPSYPHNVARYYTTCCVHTVLRLHKTERLSHYRSHTCIISFSLLQFSGGKSSSFSLLVSGLAGMYQKPSIKMNPCAFSSLAKWNHAFAGGWPLWRAPQRAVQGPGGSILPGLRGSLRQLQPQL